MKASLLLLLPLLLPTLCSECLRKMALFGKRTNLKYENCAFSKQGKQSSVSTRVKRHTCLSPEVDELWKHKEELLIKYQDAVRELELYIDETERKCMKG